MSSKYFDKALKSISLETSIRVSLMMDDYDKWHDGEYLGNMLLIEKQTQSVLRDVERWLKRGSPLRSKKIENED